jgi:S-DNA-T family DNA segregation ATPase FtsK/SpoIIIE
MTMTNALELLGAAGAALLRDRIAATSKDDGVARFLLDRLTAPQVAAVVRAVLADPMAADIEIAIPRAFADGQSLPDHVLTDETTVHRRHSACSKATLLLVNIDDDQAASLNLLPLIGCKQLSEDPRHWVDAASSGLGLAEDQLVIWRAALRGLIAAEDWTLQQLSQFVALTSNAIRKEGMPLRDALGWALPALEIPRDSGYFLALKPKDLELHTRWRKLFDRLVSERKPLLVKQRPSRQIIESDELRSQFKDVKDQIAAEAHAAIEAFVAAPPGWRAEAAALAEFEWERHSILQLFSGLRQKKSGLAQETLQFFEFECPNRLSTADQTYLDQLTKRTLKEARDDDREFFETYREDLAKARPLRAKWEKFVYGKAVECDDLLDGLLQALERLFAQSPALTARKLEVRSSKRTKGQWLDLNADVGLAFAQRYRGLVELTKGVVKWDVPHLFDFAELLEKAAKRAKYRRNESVARASLQIKFDIALSGKAGASDERTVVQLIWNGSPSVIGLELPSDLERLRKKPFVRSEVARLPVNRKGALQAVALDDITTLQPAFGQDSGSLIPRAAIAEDIGKRIPRALKEAVDEGRIRAPEALKIGNAWQAFAEAYSAALDAWAANGAAGEILIAQGDCYGELLAQLFAHAPGDLNRQRLWEPVLSLGNVEVRGGAPSSIIAPWHPLRLAAIAAKQRSFTGLVRHLVTSAEVVFGDARLFFADLRAEFAQPFYPEVTVGHVGGEPVLLAETSSLNDYSLMERPVRDPSEATTDVEPKEAARQIRDLVERYLELQPHERSNLSIMLYNCDAAGLPLAAINSLSSMQDEEEIHCNVLVRHRDRNRLGHVYNELLERSGTDADAVVVSESSRTFMSKLRIGISMDGASGTAPDEDRGVDIAFLHDVVSRQAREAWFSVPARDSNPSILEHVPARWSYRRVTAEDELKATTFLTCPRQPTIGWSYLDCVAGVVRKQSHNATEHYVPARQITFQDAALKEAFEEVHSLAEWVATYDDLLDKRQLAALGVNVIRYRRQRTHGRNMIVSSTSELRVLHVLVRRRLSELNLGIPEERLSRLADRMVREAAAISGNIVLRAAKRGVSAGELVGLVLSRALIAAELGTQATVAWFLLDDYAEWLGQREEGIADILAISVDEDEAGKLTLRAILSEAKYVDESGLAEACRKSRQQLLQTTQRMDEALFGNPGRLDRDLWLSRLSDLLLDGVTAVGKTDALERVRDGIRAGEVEIDLRGYSHIFVSGPAGDASSLGQQEHMSEVSVGLQEIFTREGLRRLLLAYESGEEVDTVRSQLGSDRPWTTKAFRGPAPRVRWVGDLPSQMREVVPSNSGYVVDALASTTRPPPVDTEVAVSQRPVVGTPENAPPPESVSSNASSPSAKDALASPPANSPKRLETQSLETFIRERGLATDEADVDASQWLDSTAQRLRTALLGYQLQAKMIGSRLTPNAALIRFQGTDRLRIEDIEAKQSALLTTHGLRLISVTPLPGEIVVGVERPKRQIVSLWDLWARRQLNRNSTGLNTSFALGLRELDGELLYLNLGGAFGGAAAHEPHTLVAGATGSGKSVLIQSLILDIAATNPSGLAKVLLIDPKMGVDYAALEKLPHVEGGVIVDQPRAIELLESLVVEMDRRYEAFRAKGARDIRTFNTKVGKNERLQTIFLIHDEFAEWMLTPEYKESVVSIVSRLGVKARAAGIHLIFAAQRPDANVVPIQLRDNLGNRLILKVASVGTSEIALGVKGAEQLLGMGHLAARLNGEPAIVFAQAPFLSDEDIDLVVESISANDQELMRQLTQA